MSTMLYNIKNFYIDHVDPSSIAYKLALRTALACVVATVIFQCLGNMTLSTWAGFAAFAIVQNDIQESYFYRLYFLLGIIITYTALVFIGLLISNYTTLYMMTAPLIIFLCAYPACLGLRYFNAGAWATVFYVLASAHPMNLHNTLLISATFLATGVLCLFICLCLFPGTPYHNLVVRYKKILQKIQMLYNHSPNDLQQQSKILLQLVQLFLIQKKTLSLFLLDMQSQFTKRKFAVYLDKLFHQLFLITECVLTTRHAIEATYIITDISLSELNSIMQNAIKKMFLQLDLDIAQNFRQEKKQLLHFRKKLTQYRVKQILIDEKNIDESLALSEYFYHYIQLIFLVEKISQALKVLQDSYVRNIKSIEK